MASGQPHVIVDDEDEDGFDWDAAVREIDVACEKAKIFETPYCTTPEAPQAANVPLPAFKIMDGASRQSTLDKFISRVAPKTDNLAIGVQDRTRVDNDDRLSYVQIDAEAAKTWIYPVNVPLRDYQFAITKTALFTNTLVALPTGLGKTLIAAVVMYNYFRWFPEGKIVFTAPSRPLVVQQIEACHNIVGIPQEWTIDLTGQLSPMKRAHFWKTKRVFFVTPQVLEKDIQSGTCLVKYLVCLVIDEAHRAMGNYSYCVAVRELMAIPVQLRLLALTATPGSKQQSIQHVIDNLLISALEYRNEGDSDVSPYVHNRKLELIEVAMGEEAIQINNLLLNVIRIFAAKLSSMGILLNRDYQTLSPSDLLNSRDKFRLAPPSNLSPVKYGEVERVFGALITLYHIRKLLSSHGIRPAYEMLEEKLQQGSFAGLMSRNEDIQKAKLLMQQSLSRGAPNPKLSKMLEVLIDHFKTNDARSSRVIIFSNFRGSVREIMDALSKVGDIVKAAQFIGQSSGKSLKGQTQKVQQAVLEKFRAGGFNVIVATSIGEEGLDIMEVDLVICFDANVSPLRMIQRMGRTGRKHDGRVVVLACEGSEMKGYMRKQANSRAIKKHMHNGGVASFNFHLSPRMIPHAYKPEVQFIELAIEKFVPRGKKVKDDQAIGTPKFREKLTDEEANMITKYFHNPENQWRPSLIAFPHFQTFPSRVHKVMHSFRTGMLIDSMQHLQGLTFSRDENEEECSFKPLGFQSIEQHNDDKNDLSESRNSPEINVDRNSQYPDRSPTSTLEVGEKDKLSKLHGENPQPHSYCFGSDFVTLDALGNVLILAIPSLPVMRISQTKQGDNLEDLGCLKKYSHDSTTAATNSEEKTTRTKAPAEGASQKECTRTSLSMSLCMVGKSTDMTHADEILLDNSIDSPCGTPDLVDVKELSLCPDKISNDFMEAEFSPQLTNYIQSGVVPESPIIGPSNSQERSGFLGTEITSAGAKKETEHTVETIVCEGNVSRSPANSRKELFINEVKDGISENRDAYSSLLDQVPMETSTSGCCSKDWCFSPSDNLRSVKHHRKLKRLRRIGETGNDNCVKCLKDVVAVSGRNSSHTRGVQNNHIRGKKPTNNARAYIEEEAEVSSGADTSDDEEEEHNATMDSYEDSFIDDRTNPTAASPGGTGPVDMMAIYRRSLLSQSPMAWQPNSASTASPDTIATRVTLMSDIGTSSRQHQSPLVHTITRSEERISESSRCAVNVPETGEASKVESKKRKLWSNQAGPLPAVNLEREFLIQTEMMNVEPANQGEGKGADDFDPFSDDQFYEDIDLDEVEAQATLLLKQTMEISKQKQENVPKLDDQNFGYLSSPSFDLGI